MATSSNTARHVYNKSWIAWVMTPKAKKLSMIKSIDDARMRLHRQKAESESLVRQAFDAVQADHARKITQDIANAEELGRLAGRLERLKKR